MQYLLEYTDTNKRTIHTTLKEVFIPYIISYYYRINPTKEKIYRIKVKSTGQIIKMVLNITGKSKFPVVDTILLRKLGLYEPNTSSLLKNELASGDTVIEIGAAYGYFTIQMSKFIGKNGLIYSFEPNKNYYLNLQRNININDCTNVITKNEGVGHKDNIFIDGSGNKFKTRSFRDFLWSLKGKVDFIFIDVDAKNPDDHSDARQEATLMNMITDYIITKKIKPKIFLEYPKKDNTLSQIGYKFSKCGYVTYIVSNRHALLKIE